MIAALWILIGDASAEDKLPIKIDADPQAIYEFAEEYGAKDAAIRAYESAMTGETALDAVFQWLKDEIRQPVDWAIETGSGLLAPILLLALLRSVMQRGNGSACGAVFLIRLMLVYRFAQTTLCAMESGAEILCAAKKFTDVASPAFIVLISAAGMQGTAALASPAAALAGNAAGNFFLDYGMPLCRISLCTAIAGNICPDISLARLTAVFRRIANWGSGLVIAAFTGLLALQGRVNEGLDSLAVRTAKYAVDSASPVIGNGVSDAWESYVSGVMIAKNALGVSGIAAMIAACSKPMIHCLLAMLVLHLAGAVLDAFGERETARAAEQTGDICQMVLSFCTASVAIVVVLLGALMSAGSSIAAWR